MTTRKKKSPKSDNGKNATDVSVKWEAVPPTLRSRVNLKYNPVLDKLAENAGKEARLGSWSKRTTATSLIVSLKATAARRADAKDYKFKFRALQDGNFAVYGVYKE